MSSSFVGGNLRVEVKHRRPAPNRFTWEIFSDDKILPVEESRNSFPSWEEAWQFGKKALKKFAAI
jgi:hypothetical protein